MQHRRSSPPRLATLLLGLALFATVLAAAVGQTPHGGSHDGSPSFHLQHGGHGGSLPAPGELFNAFVSVLQHLGVTEPQHQALEGLHRELAPQLQAAQESSLALHGVLHDAVKAGSVDEGALRTAFADDAQRQEDLLVSIARVVVDLDEILTPDQLQRLHNHLAEHFNLED